MPSLEDVYCKFGMVSEAAQIVETMLGNIILPMGLLPLLVLSEETAKDGSTMPRFVVVDQEEANQFASGVDKKTLGQLIKAAKPRTELNSDLEPLLVKALQLRNRLTHHFYRKHNLRRNTDAGRVIMMTDLETIHAVLIDAMKALSLLDGIDLDAAMEHQQTSPEKHAGMDQNQVFHLPI